MRRLYSIAPNAVSLAVMALIAANYFAVFADLDWAWQVRTGGLIIDQGTPRLNDQFSYTIDGQPLHDFEWLYEVILWAIWFVFGFGGLKFLRVILVAAPLVLVGWRLKREGVRWHGIALSLFIAILVLSPGWNLRPLVFTTIGLLLVSGWLHDHCLGRKALDWRLPATMLLWANLHPGVITGQGLLLGAIAWEWLNQWAKWNPPLQASSMKRLLFFGLLGLGATFLSPDPIERLRYTFKPELAHPIMRIFVEMQPTYSLVTKPPYALGLVYLVAGLILVTIFLRFRHYRLWELALLAGSGVLGNYAFRGLQDWLLLMLALGVPHVKELLAVAARWNRRHGGVRRVLQADVFVKRLLKSSLFCWQPAWPLGLIGLLLVASLIPPLARAMPWQESPEWPTGAVNYIEQQGLAGRFFAPPDYGSYLTWRLGSRARIYSDTRGFFYPPVILEDSIYLPQLGPDWRSRLARVLDDHGTDFFLLETQWSRGALWRRLEPYVDRPCYRDEKTVLLSAAQVRTALAQASRCSFGDNAPGNE